MYEHSSCLYAAMYISLAALSHAIIIERGKSAVRLCTRCARYYRAHLAGGTLRFPADPLRASLEPMSPSL